MVCYEGRGYIVRGLTRRQVEMSTEAFTAVWLFNLYMAYKVYHSKAWRVVITVLYFVALVGRIADALSGEGILWR